MKKKYSIIRVFLGSLFGGFSTFLVFFDVSSFSFFFLKIVICFFMIFISFSFNNFKSFLENIFYFYLVSIILAGFMYLLKNNYNIDSFRDSFFILLFVTPLVLFVYLKMVRRVNNHYNNIYNVSLYYNNKCYNFVAFLDTGNRLYDQYKRRPIILVNSDKINFDYNKGILVPYKTASSKSVLKCLKAEKIIINDSIIKCNVLFGLVEEKFNMGEVNMILHNDLIGG